MKPRYISLNEYKQSIEKLDCKELKEHNPSNVIVIGVEDFEKNMVYKNMLKKKCNASANDKVAIQFAIKHISKIADELDDNGFVELANILDETLQKFANMNCKNCK